MVRINIELDSKKMAELKDLMEAAGVSTQKEFFNNALSMTKWMMKQRKSGKVVGSLKDDRFTELATPLLDNAAKSDVDF
jgi:hypothetical protein